MRFCDELNLEFSNSSPHSNVYTHDELMAWAIIKKEFKSILTSNLQKLEVTFRVTNEGIVYVSSGSQGEKQTYITLNGLKTVISKAKAEGLKVKTFNLNNEKIFIFSFCPSNL